MLSKNGVGDGRASPTPAKRHLRSARQYSPRKKPARTYSPVRPSRIVHARPVSSSSGNHSCAIRRITQGVAANTPSTTAMRRTHFSHHRSSSHIARIRAHIRHLLSARSGLRGSSGVVPVRASPSWKRLAAFLRRRNAPSRFGDISRYRRDQR